MHCALCIDKLQRYKKKSIYTRVRNSLDNKASKTTRTSSPYQPPRLKKVGTRHSVSDQSSDRNSLNSEASRTSTTSKKIYYCPLKIKNGKKSIARLLIFSNRVFKFQIQAPPIQIKMTFEEVIRLLEQALYLSLPLVYLENFQDLCNTSI